MDVGTLESILATISVVGFVIFFGSPTVIAIVSQVEAARLLGPSGPKSEAQLLSERAAAVDDESALAKYFAKTFTDRKAINYVSLLSILFGGGALADVLAVSTGTLFQTIEGQQWSVMTDVSYWFLCGSVVMVALGVGIAIVAVVKLTSGARRALETDVREVLKQAKEFSTSAAQAQTPPK